MQSNYLSGGTPPPDSNPVDVVLWAVGTVVGGSYEILEQVYIGKHKVIYRCRETKLFSRERIIYQPASCAPQIKRAFANEQETLKHLSHPHVVIAYAVDTDDALGPYSVLENAGDMTLASVMQAERRLDLERTVNMIVQLCSALSYLHKNDIAYGAIKANHIILQHPLGKPESIKLIDFSLARVARSRAHGCVSDWSEVFQTVGYPSPEELRTESCDHRSDIYSLGCLLYRVLTGKAPFNGSSALEIRRKHLEEDAPSLKETYPQGRFTAQIEECVKRMLAKDPSKRYQSADDLALDLRFAARRC